MHEDNNLPVIFEKTHPDAKMPTKATAGSACWDVYAVEDADVEYGVITVIDLGLKVKVPSGYELVVRPRSGLAFKHGITIVNSPGTVDSDYRGPLKVALASLNKKHTTTGMFSVHTDINLNGHYMGIDTSLLFKINKGDRIAQIKLQRVLDWECVEGKVEADTDRGEGGFGSTGK